MVKATKCNGSLDIPIRIPVDICCGTSSKYPTAINDLGSHAHRGVTMGINMGNEGRLTKQMWIPKRLGLLGKTLNTHRYETDTILDRESLYITKKSEPSV